MKLNKKDKEELLEAFKEMLSVDITWEKFRDDDGTVNSAPIVKHEKVFLPSIFMQILKGYEGSNRGLQEDLCKQRDIVQRLAATVEYQNKQIEVLGKALLSFEKPLLAIAQNKQLEDVGRKEKLEAVIKDKASSKSEKDKAARELEKL